MNPLASSIIKRGMESRILTIRNGSSYRAVHLNTAGGYSPYGILIVGYRYLGVVGSTTTTGALSYLDHILNAESSPTLSDGTLTFGVSNRQYFAICPVGVTLVEQ